ncbi:MAG: response regulator [Candidatus Anammoxibacter sp.]
MPDQKPNILLVDDEKDIIETLNDIFMDTYNVFKALNAKDALDILQEEDIAIIMSDYKMQGITGTELLTESFKIEPKTVRILLTGYAELGAGLEAEKNGTIDKYLEKPWDDDELLELIDGFAKDYEKSKDRQYAN